MPTSAPPVAPPGATNPPCTLVPKPVGVAGAKQRLTFPVFALGADPAATPTGSQYAQGCDGSLGLELDYTVSGFAIELVESKSASPNGPAAVHVKSNGGMTAADAGWSVAQIAGQPYAVNVTSGGKDVPAGIVGLAGRQHIVYADSCWHAPDANGASITPIPSATFQEIVTTLTLAYCRNLKGVASTRVSGHSGSVRPTVGHDAIDWPHGRSCRGGRLWLDGSPVRALPSAVERPMEAGAADWRGCGWQRCASAVGARRCRTSCRMAVFSGAPRVQWSDSGRAVWSAPTAGWPSARPDVAFNLARDCHSHSSWGRCCPVASSRSRPTARPQS